MGAAACLLLIAYLAIGACSSCWSAISRSA